MNILKVSEECNSLENIIKCVCLPQSVPGRLEFQMIKTMASLLTPTCSGYPSSWHPLTVMQPCSGEDLGTAG